MPTFAVEYAYDDRRDIQDTVRPEHRAYLRGLADQGALLGSGPWADGTAGAMLVFRTANEAALQEILAADPFARAGVIRGTAVRPWNVVIGPWASAD